MFCRPTVLCSVDPLYYVVFSIVGDSPASGFYMPSSCLHRLWRWNWHSVPKRRHIKFRLRGITQKKEYDIQKKAEVWIRELLYYICWISVLNLFRWLRGHKYFPWELPVGQPCCTVCTSSVEERWSVLGSLPEARVSVNGVHKNWLRHSRADEIFARGIRCCPIQFFIYFARLLTLYCEQYVRMYILISDCF